MLGRTANGIFWMFRYLERAENSARLLDAGFRLALMRGSRTDQEEWRSVLTTLGLQSKFAAAHAETSRHAVTNFILRERDNPGSVLNMVEHARNNARGVRTAITREVWEATNECWMELKQLLARPVRAREFFPVLSAIRRHATLVRGAMEETMLRNEIYNFARLGTFLERADNTARILDVKYYVLLPAVSWVGTNLDNVQWETVLRSVSGERAYRWLNAGGIDPRGIARFLILDGTSRAAWRFVTASCAAIWQAWPRNMARKPWRRSCCTRPAPGWTSQASKQSSQAACTNSSPASWLTTANSPRRLAQATGSPFDAPGDPSCHPLRLRPTGGLRLAASAADAQTDPWPDRA